MKHLVRRFNAILTMVTLMTVCAGSSLAATHYVGVNQPGPGYEYNAKTIQEAITYSYDHYTPDDTVEIDVYPGQYIVDRDGKIDLSSNSKPILKVRKHPDTGDAVICHWGNTYKETVHVGTGEFSGFILERRDFNKTFTGVSITGPGIVKNCVITGYEFGVKGFCASNASNQAAPVVMNCDVFDCINGLSVGEMNVVFKRNKIHDNEIGMSFGPGGSPQLIENFFHHNGTGIAISSYHAWASLAEISNNVIYKNGYGIYATHKGYYSGKADFAICNVIQDNIIVDNSEWGIFCDDNIPFPTGYDFLMQLRNNDVWNNGSGQDNYYNCPTPIDSISVDPKLEIINDWAYVSEESLCVDKGSRTLNPGLSVEGTDGDTKSVDLGYHQNDLPDVYGEELYTGEKWIVDGDARLPYDFRTISEAISSARVRDGDVLRVRQTRRPYQENLDVSKAVMIEAAELNYSSRPVILASSLKPGVSISQKAKLKHLVIQAALSSLKPRSGILVKSAACIENCEVAGFAFGIEVGTPDSVRIQYCEVTHNMKGGVTLSGGTTAYLFSNWIAENTGSGVLVRSDKEIPSMPYLANNTIWANKGDGIRSELTDGHEGISAIAMNNVIFSNQGFGYTSNRLYTLVDRNVYPPAVEHFQDNGVYIQLRNNNIWGNGAYLDPTDARTNFGYDEDMDVDYWFSPMPNYSVPGRMLTPRVFNHMSVAPGYDFTTLLLSPDSECIDAGNQKLNPGDVVFGTSDTGRVDIGAHQIVIH